MSEKFYKRNAVIETNVCEANATAFVPMIRLLPKSVNSWIQIPTVPLTPMNSSPHHLSILNHPLQLTHIPAFLPCLSPLTHTVPDLTSVSLTHLSTFPSMACHFPIP